MKCGLVHLRPSPKTDIRARWAACSEWQPEWKIDLEDLTPPGFPRLGSEPIDRNSATLERWESDLRLALAIAGDKWDDLGEPARARRCRAISQLETINLVFKFSD